MMKKWLENTKNFVTEKGAEAKELAEKAYQKSEGFREDLMEKASDLGDVVLEKSVMVQQKTSEYSEKISETVREKKEQYMGGKNDNNT